MQILSHSLGSDLTDKKAKFMGFEVLEEDLASIASIENDGTIRIYKLPGSKMKPSDPDVSLK